MRALIIDTCLASCSAAMIDIASGRVIASARQLMERGHAEAIAPIVKSVLAQSEASNLSSIAVTIGPGTFTGVRIGLALAQGIGLARGIPLIGIDTMLATAAPLLSRAVPVVVAHKAGATGQVFVRVFGADGKPTMAIELKHPGEVQIPAHAVMIGTGSDMIEGAHKRSPEHDLPDAALFGPLAIRLPVANGTLQPIYVREPDAKPQVKLPTEISVARVGSTLASLLAELHASSFAKGWSSADLGSMIDVPGTVSLLGTVQGLPAGMIVVRAIADEAEILTLATVPQFRKIGVAKKILLSTELYLKALRVTSLHLEVAADNVPALALYRGAGFAESGVRKAYYERGDSRVDAILMRRELR